MTRFDMQVESAKLFFTADHHFEHKNVIDFCHRPFSSVDLMNEELVMAWNDVVPTDGIVYHLGDFSLSGWNRVKSWMLQLNGRIILLRMPWHHDRFWIEEYERRIRQERLPTLMLIPPIEVLDLDFGEPYPKRMTLCHYPMKEWESSFHKAWLLHGHSHGAAKYEPHQLAIDVGVDEAYRMFSRYRPFTLKEVVMIMRSKENELGWAETP